MTTQNETTTAEKQVPVFYIFETAEANGKKESKRISAALTHKKGNGFTLLVNGKRYAAFPPKAKAAGDTAQPELPTPGEGAYALSPLTEEHDHETSTGNLPLRLARHPARNHL